MKTIKFLFALITFISAQMVQAQTVNHYWDSMNDSLIVNKGNAEVTNANGQFLEAKISSALCVQLKMMKNAYNLPVLCLVRTYMAPAKDSVVELYDKDWNRIAVQRFSLEDIIGKENTSRLEQYFEPLLIHASLNGESDDMVLTVCDKMLSDEEKKELLGISLSKTVTWNAQKTRFQ